MKRKINSPKKNFSDEELLRNMDFNALMKRHSTAPRKHPIKKIMMFSISLLIALSAAFWLTKDNKKTEAGRVQSVDSLGILEDSNKVNWPIKPFISTMVSIKDSTILNLENGVKIIIPPGAFVVTNVDSVLFTYRYYNDWADILFGGIPMNYDSSNVSYNLVSDGMIEVFAEANGRVININENVPIEIQIPITDTSRNYNIYRFDTARQLWNYESPIEEFSYLSSVEPIPTATIDNISDDIGTQDLIALENSLKRLEKRKLTPPLEKADGDIVFKLDFDRMEFPEIAGYDEIEFIPIENGGFKKEYMNANWNEIRLNKNRRNQSYFITLSNDIDRVQFNAQPVFSGKDLKKALAEFEQQKTSIQLDIRKKQQEIEKLKLEKEARLREKEKRARKVSVLSYNEGKKYRVMRVSFIGLLNIDSPIPINISFPSSISPRYLSESGEELQLKKAYLVEDQWRTYFTFDPNKKLKYNNNRKTRIIVITNSNDVYHYDKLNEIEKEDDTYNFVMEKIELNNRSSENVKRVLGIL